MKNELSSKERILKTLSREPVDHIPCAFVGICHGYARFLGSFNTPFDEADYFLGLGVDTAVHLLPKSPHLGISMKEVKITQHIENIAGEKDPVWVKDYYTPSGRLRQAVRKNDHYPHANIPLFADEHVTPARSLKYLIDSEEELEAFRAMLKAPTRDELCEEYAFSAKAQDYCSTKGILLVGDLSGIGDPLLWLSGIENLSYAAADNPEFLHEYVNILSDWNIDWMSRMIDMGADMILRRGWYESTDFWSPKLYRDFLLKPLQKEVKLAHEAGVRYAYIMNSGATPLAEELKLTGIDMLTNLEPEKNDLPYLKKKIGDSMTLCTGINNYHVIEEGAEEDVEAAVIWAMETLAPGGGFILSPSDSINHTNIICAGNGIPPNSEKIIQNFFRIIDTWKRMA